jgi:hypothetical protein
VDELQRLRGLDTNTIGDDDKRQLISLIQHCCIVRRPTTTTRT